MNHIRGAIGIAIFLLLIPGTTVFSTDAAAAQVGFQVRWDGKVIPGVVAVSGLRRVTEATVNRAGETSNRARRSPGSTEYDLITITRVKGKDAEFEKWADLVFKLQAGPGAEMSLKNFRKDIIIEILDQKGKVFLSYKVFRCWPSEYEALSGLDSKDDSVATESLILQHEGFERDAEVVW